MRDGARLATDIYLPRAAAARRQPLATVLVRLPYDKSARFSFMPQIAERFVRRLEGRGDAAPRLTASVLA
jgi:uncharacterized protein